jgi:hypothetical protein
MATSSGTINSIRFFKDSSESGTHTGKIYSASGTMLASAVFSGETASGWQQQALSSPLSINANTEYTVSVNTGNTFYVTTVSGMASQVVNGDLVSILGNNGVYGSVGTMPTSSFQSSNYFRDLVFVAGSSTSPPPTADTQAPTVSITSPLTGATVPVKGTVTITATASDNVRVSEVKFYSNNTLKCTDTTSPFTCSFIASSRAGRSYTLQAKAYDAAGNVGSSATIQITTK